MLVYLVVTSVHLWVWPSYSGHTHVKHLLNEQRVHILCALVSPPRPMCDTFLLWNNSMNMCPIDGSDIILEPLIIPHILQYLGGATWVSSCHRLVESHENGSTASSECWKTSWVRNSVSCALSLEETLGLVHRHWCTMNLSSSSWPSISHIT